MPTQNFAQFQPGYLQTRAQSNQGLPLLASEFIEKFEKTGLCHVELDEWNTKPTMQAEWITRLAMPFTPRLMTVSYSWGAGFGFTRLARELRDRGVEIQIAVLCDAVYHWGPAWMHGFRIPGTEMYVGLSQLKAYYPYSLCTNWLVKHFLLPPRPIILIPDNVVRLEWFKQENSVLHGHELFWEDTYTLCDGPHPTDSRRSATRHLIKYRNHTSMDECPEFFAMARACATQLFTPVINNS